MNNILAVVAHPDDLELMAGGSILKWKKQGKKIHVLTLSKGIWIGMDGKKCRSYNSVKSELDAVQNIANYDSLEVLDEPCMEIRHSDRIVCEVLKRISQYNIDTILTTWDQDTHHDHKIVSEIVKSASRKVKTILMGHINYYEDNIFAPDVFVDITNEWEQKIELVSQYKTEWP